MSRGLPAVWSALMGTPFALAGVWSWLGRVSGVPSMVGIPVTAFGLFVIGTGLYIHFIAAPDQPQMRSDETLIDTRTPANRAAIAKSIVGFGFLVAAGYLLAFTFTPYVYPTSTFVVGLYVFSTGFHNYWTNTLTTYYVTDRRLIREYRFISLVRQELPFNKVRGVQESKSLWEALVGLGNVRVSSGGGQSLEIKVRNIYRTTRFADKIREQM